MRLISFAHTVDQIRDRTKTVTRRRGWRFAKPGMQLRAVDRSPRCCEPMETLGIIEIVSVHREPLDAITAEDLRDEGFPGMSREEFLEMFTRTFAVSTCQEPVTVTRFKYIDEEIEA